MVQRVAAPRQLIVNADDLCLKTTPPLRHLTKVGARLLWITLPCP